MEAKSHGDRSLGELISDMMLNELSERDNEDQDESRVNLMTLHASKGLEFRHVIIVGVEEDSLPHRVAVDNDDIDEERRLFYVGITRAMETLQLSYASRRKRFGEWMDRDPSRFLSELPADDLEWDSEETRDSEESMTSGRKHLANIRALRRNRVVT
jgi:ATP-dependent DNA helicase Rep